MTRSGKLLVAVFVFVIFLSGYASAMSLSEIRDVAAAPAQEGDVQFTWWDQYLENSIQLGDGRTVWMQTNFWNIVGGDGEVFMKFTKSTEDFAFYVDLKNVETQWGGIAWATPEVIIDGRAPAQWWGDKPPVGGYDYAQLPMPASDLSNYDHIWVKAKYDVAKDSNALVRFGINIWFESTEGAPLGEVYVPFMDDFGGIVGDRTEVGELTSTVIVNGKLSNMKFTIQRALSGGGWGVLLFMPEEQLPASGEVLIDIAPMVKKVSEQLADFFGIPVENQAWASISIGSYSGGNDPQAGFRYGWIIHEAKVLSPSEAPIIATVTETKTETVTETKTETETKTTTETKTETTTKTTTKTVTETTTETTTAGGGICGPGIIVALAVVPLLLRRRR